MVHVAAKSYSRSQCLRLLLESGGSVYITTALDGCTPLHVAAKHGNLAAIFICVEFGADILARNTAHQTPREAAVQHFSWLKRFLTGSDPVACLRRLEIAFEQQVQ